MLTAGDVNNFPSLVWFNEDVPSDYSLQVIKPIAKARIEASKAAGKDVMMFYVVGNDTDDEEEEAVVTLRSFARLGRDNPLLTIIDVSDQTVSKSVEHL